MICEGKANTTCLCSEHLDSEAIVEYVKALVLIAEEELQPVSHPRVFSLTKIVEISDFNMGRIRQVSHLLVSLLLVYTRKLDVEGLPANVHCSQA